MDNGRQLIIIAHPEHSSGDRVATHSGKRKMVKKIPCREKSGNLKFC